VGIVDNVGPRIPRRALRPAVYAVSAAGVALGLLVVATWNPVAIVLLLIAPAPALGLSATAPAQFEMRQRGGGRGFTPLVGGGVAGVGMAAFGPHLLGLEAPLIGAAAGALAGFALALATLRKTKLAAPIQYAVILSALFALYGGAALMVIDVRFDTARPQVFRAAIADKYVRRGRQTNYILAVPPWGPRTRPSTIGVASSLYDSVQVGDPICMTLHPGALGSAWYEAVRCADGGPTTASAS